MIKTILLLIPILSFALTNPYEDLSTDEKINILVNSFVNQELQLIVPPAPIKPKLKDSSPIVPIKYELHFSFIQRFKAITESRTEEQQKIDDKYIGDVGFYNGKLKSLKRYYKKDENLNPIIQNSINKTYKIIYGKPKLKDVNYNKKENKITAKVFVSDIYGFNKWEEKDIIISIPDKLKDTFIDRYREAMVNIAFEYENNILRLSHLNILFQHNTYKAIFVDNTNEKIKLEIKINDDIFQLVKIEDKKWINY